MYDIFHSIEDVWGIWIVSLIALIIGCRLALRRCKWGSIRKFSGNERGASYALPYVLTFPIFLLIMAMLIQATFIILVKIGTVYAAHSAARTYIVWQSMNPAASQFLGGDEGDYIRYKTQKSATMGMAPFANSNTRQRTSLFPLYPLALNSSSFTSPTFYEKGGLDLPVTLANLLSSIDARAYGAAYRRLVADAQSKDTANTHQIINQKNLNASQNYIDSKFAYAAAATRVETPSSRVAWNQDVEITLRYRMAFHIPVTGRIFAGDKRPWSPQLFRDIETTISLPSEAAQTSDGKIGIPYNIFLF